MKEQHTTPSKHSQKQILSRQSRKPRLSRQSRDSRHRQISSLTETERTLFQKGLIKNTGIFFVVFAALLLALGFFVYQQVSSNLFGDVDRQLNEATNLAGNEAHITQPSADDALSQEEDVIANTQANKNDSLLVSESLSGAVMNSAMQSAGLNPQLTFMMRNLDGTCATAISIDENSPNYLKDLPFDKTSLEKPVLQNFENQWLRSVAIPLKTEGETQGYLQVISNVDSEIFILDSFTTTMAVAFCLALLVAAGLSYLLSRRAMQPAAQAWRQQTQFVQDASHELRTPLTVIKTVQEELLSHPHDSIVDHFEEISTTVEEADRLAQLSQSLLAVSSLDAGRETLNKQPIDFDALITSATAPYAEYAALQNKSFEVITESKAKVFADEKAIKQLLAIVLDNALKYSDSNGTIKVHTSGINQNVKLEVHNTGAHLTSEEASRAFERFYRSETARAQTSGSGLGLALAQRITKAHHGDIELIPNETGACVQIVLPKQANE